MLDLEMRRVIGRNPVMATAWYLTAGYAYEVLDEPIISDGAWDELCQFVQKYRTETLQHRHGHLIDDEALASGTAGYLTESYLPSLVKCAAFSRAKELTLKSRKRKASA